jgi:hypothetical protein
MPTGLYTIDDLIATRFANAKAFGLSTIAEVLRADLEAHNAIVSSMVSELCDITGDARRLTGGSNTANMTEVDPLGRAPSQKAVSGYEVGFPLKMFQFATGWTERYLENATVADVAQKQLDAEKAHMRQVIRQIRKAIFTETNYSFIDLNVDNVSIAIKAFCNSGDATYIPPDGPDGTTFSVGHDHFSSTAGGGTAVVGDYTTIIDTVQEHGHTGATIIAINIADETIARAMAGFSAYVDMRLGTNQAANQPIKRLDYRLTNNRPIGILHGAEVWVKSWVPHEYAFCYDPADSRKPLGFRQRSAGGALQGLRTAGNFSTHPFGGEIMEAEFGVGVWTRTNGAACFSNGGAWVDPTIA